MIEKLSHITILVKNQDEALKFYTEKLGFKVHTDAAFGEMRWLTICPQGQPDLELVLLLATTPEEKSHVGNQVGSGALASFETKQCKKTYETLKSRGVTFLGEPQEESWGIGVAFKDLYGNTFYLVEPR